MVTPSRPQTVVGVLDRLLVKLMLVGEADCLILVSGGTWSVLVSWKALFRKG